MYTESGGTGAPSIDTAQAIAIMLEKHEVACDILHGFDWGLWTTGTGVQRLSLIPAAQEHVLEQEDGKQRFIKVVTDLSRALPSVPPATKRPRFATTSHSCRLFRQH